MSQDKAQFSANGCSIGKYCNAVLTHLVASIRARREAVICFVASFVKDAPFTARHVLHLTASQKKGPDTLFQKRGRIHFFEKLNVSGPFFRSRVG